MAATVAVVTGGAPAQATDPTVGDKTTEYSYDFYNGTTTDPRLRAQLKAVRAKLPAGFQEQQQEMREDLGIDPRALSELQSAIDPDDFVCGPTGLNAFVNRSLRDVNLGTLLALALLGAFDLPTYDSLFFGKPNDPRYAVLASKRKQLSKDFRQARVFWDIDSDDIQLLGMNGSTVRDVSRMKRIYRTAFGFTAKQAKDAAEGVALLVKSDPALDKGDHPLFSLNAFAFSAEVETDPIFADIADKVVMGDGLIAAVKELNLGFVGPRTVLAHEFGHHIQFERGEILPGQEPTPEGTRRTELMADALSAYFTIHRSGLGLTNGRVTETIRTFYIVGDCQFYSPGHHGTPKQRARSSRWGASISRSPGDPITQTVEFIRLFDVELPRLVAPDAPF
jgi:hypothetical protein